jgi:serine/threonine protein kinase
MAIKTVPDFHEWREMRRRRGSPVDESLYQDLLTRFRREAVAWVRLGKHANIVFAWWVIEIGDKPFLLMEYADSGDLGTWIKEHRLDVPLAVNFALQFCEGMMHAVKSGNMVHRDIKPANALIHDGRILKIADFGLARAFFPASEEPSVNRPQSPDGSLSLAGAGTRAYMPPEQFQSLALADTRSDVFSFGATFYEMLTSRQLFAARSAYEMALLKQGVPLADEIDSRVPRVLSSIVARCLAYDPSDRYQSFEALAADLQRVTESLPGRLPIPQDPTEELSGLLTPALRVQRETYSLISLGRYDAAAQCAERGIDIDPENWVHWLNKGKALMELEEYADARECFDRATRLCPESARSWSNLGWAELQSGNASAALAAAQRATHLDEGFGEAWMCRGCCEREVGHDEEALRSLELSTELAPHDWKTHYNLGSHLANLWRGAEAFTSTSRAIQINPGNSSPWGLLGLLHFRAGFPEEAETAIDKALHLDPDNAAAWLTRACVLWEGHRDAPGALASLENVLRLDPENKQAELVRQEIEVVLGK